MGFEETRITLSVIAVFEHQHHGLPGKFQGVDAFAVLSCVVQEHVNQHADQSPGSVCHRPKRSVTAGPFKTELLKALVEGTLVVGQFRWNHNHNFHQLITTVLVELETTPAQAQQPSTR